MKLCLSALLAILPMLAGSCGGIAISNNNLVMPRDARATLSLVVFDHAKWSNQDAEFLAKMRLKEPEWRSAVQGAFAKVAEKRGLDAGAGAEVAVRIRVDDLDPGSRAMRYWVGFGAGTGILKATADCGSHGSFNASAKVAGGVFGGDFENVLRHLGSKVADTIADARK